MVRITQDFLNHLSPVELSFIRTGIDKLYKEKVTPDTTNYENIESHVQRCPHCGSVHFVKNGFNPKHRQKYRCKDCSAVFMATTGTMFTHSCFNMRHKLYKAISKVQENAVLSGDVELDPSYTSINLKGTEPANMPRMSKHRGKHKATPYFHHIPGTSHHKICIVAAIDENDQMLFKIGGLGRESFQILNQYRKHFSDSTKIISDDSHSIQTFVSENGFESDVIPSGAYVSPNGNTVSSVNELHAEAKNMIRQKHGVSTRHLQGYLDWIVFKKKLKYTLDMRKWKPEAYMESMLEQIPFICRDIVKLPLPIDLYGEYHYGVFSNIN